MELTEEEKGLVESFRKSKVMLKVIAGHDFQNEQIDSILDDPGIYVKYNWGAFWKAIYRLNLNGNSPNLLGDEFPNR